MTLLGILLMAILTFAPSAPLSGFESYLMQRGMEATCHPLGQADLQLLAQRLHPGVYAEAGDSVRFSAFLTSGSAVIDYGGQWQNEKGIYSRYNHTINISSGASPVRATRAASAGWYRDAVASLQTAGITGQTLYITQELGRQNAGAFAPFAMLAQGWLTSQSPVSSNAPPLPDGGGASAGGGCCLETIVNSNWDPDTVNPKTFTVAAGTNARLVYLEFGYTTSATVGDRFIYLQVAPTTGQGFEVFSLIAQPASTSYSYTFQAGGPTFSDVAGDGYFWGIPEGLWFSGDIEITIQAAGVKAGDLYSLTTASFATRGP